MSLLIKAGADVNVKGGDDITPLYWADDLQIIKQLVLLLLVGVSFNLYGSESDLSHITFGRSIRKGVHDDSVSKEKTDAVLSDPEVLKLFEAVDRLLTILPKKGSDDNCVCVAYGKHHTIKLHYMVKLCTSWTYEYEMGMLCAPWTRQCIDSDIHNISELLISNGFEFEKKFLLNRLHKIKITAFGGKVLPSRNLSAPERCVMFAAFKQYQLPQERAARARWSPARSAWIGAVVRSGNARKPVVVVAAAELKE